ncbi:MAG: hypothetical protein NTX86_03075 [Candidatus Dependentiae bacterium]|nr:hypothetical protein [Candidatus Dependentiae bacterium]
MKKLLVSLLLVSVITVGVRANNEMAADVCMSSCVDRNVSEKIADFLTSEDFSYEIQGFFDRSAQPTKELLRGLVMHADFNKQQLGQVKLYLNDFLVLAAASKPFALDFIFDLVRSVELRDFAKIAIEKKVWEVDGCGQRKSLDSEEALTQAGDRVQEFLGAALDRLDESGLAELWTSFIGDVVCSDISNTMSDQVIARWNVCQEPMKEHLQIFVCSMALVHITRAEVFMNKFDLSDTWLEEVKRNPAVHGLGFVNQLHSNVVENEAVLKERLGLLVQRVLDTYGALINEVIDEALAQF